MEQKMTNSTKGNETMTNQKTWSTNQPTYNWSNISEHPASPAWGQMDTLPKSTDEWHLSDIDPSEWMSSEDEFMEENETETKGK